MQPSILIADDHPLVLKGLEDFLIEKGFNVIAAVSDGKQAFDMIVDLNPDIAVLDIRMPFMTGIEIAEACKTKNLKTKIIIITFEKEEKLYQQAKLFNVSGYILKEFALVEIENCIAAVNRGETYFSEELINNLEILKIPEEFKLLTPTEKEILKLIAKNKTAKEIGEALFISNRTVEKHKSNIIKKLKIKPFQNNLLIWVKENQDFII